MRELQFPYEYGSDLHWLWGWGARLEAAVLDDLPISRHVWFLLYPDRNAKDAMARFSIKYPLIIKQVQDCLDFADRRYDEFRAEDTEDTQANLADAMFSLCGRILSCSKIIAEHETPATPPVAPSNDARDKWLYENRKKGMGWQSLEIALRKKITSQKKHPWEPIGMSAIRQAVDRYIARHNLPPLPQ